MPDPLTGLGLTSADVINAIGSQNVQAPVETGSAPGRPPMISNCRNQYPDEGPADIHRRVRADRDPDRSRWLHPSSR